MCDDLLGHYLREAVKEHEHNEKEEDGCVRVGLIHSV